MINDYDPELPSDFPEADPPLPPGWKIITQDDMPPSVRTCFRASDIFSAKAPTAEDEAWAREHWNACPECMEDDAENTLRDAMWWRYEADEDPAPYPDGTYRSPEQAAQEIEAEAIELRLRAAKIREARS